MRFGQGTAKHCWQARQDLPLLCSRPCLVPWASASMRVNCLHVYPNFFLPACHCFIIISTKKILKTQGKAESHQLRPNKARSRSRRARWNPMKEVLVYITLSYKSKSPRSPKKRERKNKADGHTHARTQQHKCMVQAGSIKSIDQWVHGTPAGSIVVTANARPPHEISSMDHKPSVLKCVRSDVVLYILLRRGRRRQLR